MVDLTDANELVSFAKKLLKGHTNTLRDNVHLCITYGVPNLGFLYSFLVVNFVSALYTGDAERTDGIRANTTKYLTEFVNYSERETSLLQKIFNTYTSNLLQPKPVVLDDKTNRYITWHLSPDYYSQNKHLKLTKHSRPKSVQLPNHKRIMSDYSLTINLPQFLKDIENSIFRKRTGYIELLKTKSSLQENFCSSLNHILEPN